MLGDIDKNLKPYEYRLFLCKPNKTTVCELPEAYSRKLIIKYGGIHELNFSIPYKIQKNKKYIRNDHVDLIRGHYLVRVERKDENDLFLDKMYFIITKPRNVAQDGKQIKEVQCFLLPYEIRNKTLKNYFKKTNTLRGHLSETLERKTKWVVGRVPSDLEDSNKVYRTFDESKINLLDFLHKIAETFDVVMDFDTINRKINFYKNEEFGKDQGLFIEYGKYLKAINEEPDFDNVVTRLHCRGAENLSFRNINPAGSDYVECYAYYMHPFERDENKNIIKHSNYMSDELCHAILDYNELVESKEGEFTTLLDQKKQIQELLTEKQTALRNLNDELDILEDNLDIANANEQDGEDIVIQIDAKKDEITAKEDEITIVEMDLADVNSKIDVLKNTISIENNFTQELINEWETYIIESDWEDSHYIDEKELYEDAKKKLVIKSQPLIAYNIDIVDFLKVVKCQKDWKKLNIGDIVTIKYDDFNINIKAKIVEISHDIDENNISLKIANDRYLTEGFLSLADIIDKTISTSTDVDMSKYKWNETSEKTSIISEIIDGKWDAIAREIEGGTNNSVSFGKRGIIIKDPLDPQKYLVANHGVLALTNDGGRTWKHAITPEGVVRELFYCKILKQK